MFLIRSFVKNGKYCGKITEISAADAKSAEFVYSDYLFYAIVDAPTAEEALGNLLMSKKVHIVDISPAVVEVAPNVVEREVVTEKASAVNIGRGRRPKLSA